MGFDAMANRCSAPSAAAAAARDAAKKKRGNRSAKLKQCKLDARREQWLSQVKDSKETKGMGKNAGQGSPILTSPGPHPPIPRSRRAAAAATTPEMRGEEEEREEPGGGCGGGQEIGSSDLDSPTHSSASRGSASRKQYPGNHSSCSSGSAWSSSRSVSDAEDEEAAGGREEEEEENGVLDDWEAVADALSVDNNHSPQNSGPTALPAGATACPAQAHAATRPELIRSKSRAWRPDDEFRPQSLPSICKQASFPASMGQHWVGMGAAAAQKGILSLPSSCPICYEDLDPTDSSFLPCPCGFHLCLFCHKRILEADGRCPGCRKQYDSVPAGGMAVVGNGRETANILPMRLSRSCSMGPRY